MEADTFVVFSTVLESAKCLNDEDRNELCYVVLEYGFTGVLVECSQVVKAIMLSIMPNIDSSKKRYKKNLENGKKGGRPKTQTKPKINPNKTQTKPNPNLDKDKDKDKDKDIYNKRQAFIPPTLNEVKEYQVQKCNNVDAEYFYEYFTEGNWIDSKGNKVKSWKQKMISWNRQQNNTPKQQKEEKQVYDLNIPVSPYADW